MRISFWLLFGWVPNPSSHFLYLVKKGFVIQGESIKRSDEVLLRECQIKDIEKGLFHFWYVQLDSVIYLPCLDRSFLSVEMGYFLRKGSFESLQIE